MHLNVGDLVEDVRDKKLGIIISTRPSNNSIRQQKNVSPDVYYVLFQSTCKSSGPYFTGDLSLKQQRTIAFCEI